MKICLIQGAKSNRMKIYVVYVLGFLTIEWHGIFSDKETALSVYYEKVADEEKRDEDMSLKNDVELVELIEDNHGKFIYSATLLKQDNV